MLRQHIAVLGGGISGLSGAFHLSRRFPNALITVVEKSPRFGGWIRSQRVQVDDAHGARASVVLEAGPRTLRASNSAHVLELVKLLGLKDDIITTPNSSPAARNRFLLLPGSGLTPLPNSPLSLFTNPLGRSLLIPAVLRDLVRMERDADEDESVDAFFARHFGQPFARTLASALVHGIYAADSRALSLRAAFPDLPALAQRGRGSVVRGAIMNTLRPRKAAQERLESGDVPALMAGVSVFSFRDGMEALPRALVAALSANPNVQLLANTESTLAFNPESRTFDASLDGPPITHVLSTLRIPDVARILGTSSTPYPSTSVTVVNLVFPPASAPLHPAGFGYLVPRPAAGYGAPENDAGVLGVVFDSCALAPQDRDLTTKAAPYGSSRFTKMTLMLGGPYPSSPASTLTTLLDRLALHLGPLPAPVLTRVHRHEACIPTFAPGHVRDVERVREEVEARTEGRMVIAGSQVGGVSVDACVGRARRAALEARWGL